MKGVLAILSGTSWRSTDGGRREHTRGGILGQANKKHATRHPDHLFKTIKKRGGS